LPEQEWRLINDIDDVLNEPQPAFHAMKRLYEHGVVCKTKTGGGYVVFVEKVGQIRKNWAVVKVWGSGLRVEG
jgi:hypothetical protein